MSAEPMEVLRLAPLWEIDCGAGDAPVGFGVGPDGELLAVTQDAPIERHVVGAGGSRFAKSRERVGRRLRVVGPDGLRLELADERWWYDFVQPMPDGGTLLVGARASAHAPDNVAVYGADGRCLRSFGVGDGVAEVQATADGDLWVSYFDQGIFGGAAADGTGLARFSADGALEFAYRGDELGTDDICDCYALNVASAVDTWLYFYTAFELVRLRDGRAKVWRGLPRGARALAVHADRLMLFGDYERPDALRVFRLGHDGRVHLERAVALADADGATLGRARAVGRGDALVLRAERRVFRLTAWEL